MSTTEALQLGLTFALVGMVVVFVVLGTIAILIGGLNRWSDRVDARIASEAPPTAKPAAAPAGGAVDPRLVAVLTAAATATLNRPVRVREVRRHQ